MNLIREHVIQLLLPDWVSLALLLDDEETGRFAAQFFPGFQVQPDLQAQALLAKCLVLMNHERDVAVLFDEHPLGQVVHILALPAARHGRAKEFFEWALAFAFVEAGFYRVLGVGPVDHQPVLKLGLKSGMHFLHRGQRWETHYLDYLGWITSSPLLQKLGVLALTLEGPWTLEDAALEGLKTLVSPDHPLLAAAQEILGGFGAGALETKEV